MRKCSYHLLPGVIKLRDLRKQRIVLSPFDRQAACPRSQSWGTTEEIHDPGQTPSFVHSLTEHLTLQSSTGTTRFSLLFPFLILFQVDTFLQLSSPNLEYSILDKLNYLQLNSSATPFPVSRSLPRDTPIHIKPTFFCPPQ